MSLQIETIETNEPSVGMPGVDAHMELLRSFQLEVQTATGIAVERSMGYADRMSQDLLAKVKNELMQFSKPSEKILTIKMDEVKRKLTKAASPYLGEVLIQAKLGLNTMLVGPAGCGKTTLAAQVGEALGMRYAHLSLSQGASETWLLGRWTPGGTFAEAAFVDFFANGGVFLLDEIDASDANLLVTINTALANGSLYNPMTGKSHARHKDFVMIAAGNTFGKGGTIQFTGRTRLDAATLDRFAAGVVEMDYDDGIEAQLCPDKALRKRLQKARKFLKDKNSIEMITTRALMNSYALKSQGITEKRIFEKLTASWPKELAEQSGLLKEETPEIVIEPSDSATEIF